MPEDVGAPDGMTVDAAGDLWVAIYGGGAGPPLRTRRLAARGATPSRPGSARAVRSAGPACTGSTSRPRRRAGRTSSVAPSPPPGSSTGSTRTRPADRQRRSVPTPPGGRTRPDRVDEGSWTGHTCGAARLIADDEVEEVPRLRLHLGHDLQGLVGREDHRHLIGGDLVGAGLGQCGARRSSGVAQVVAGGLRPNQFAGRRGRYASSPDGFATSYDEQIDGHRIELVDADPLDWTSSSCRAV